MNTLQNQFSTLRLHGMNQAYEALVESRQHLQLSLSEGLQILLQSELEDKQNRKYQRLLNNAKFRYKASMSEVLVQAKRGLDQNLIAQLTIGDYIGRGHSILITGSTGCGKSFLASALGNQACAQGYKVAYFNVQKLLLRCKLSRVDGTQIKFFKALSTTDLLILDDFGIATLDNSQRLDLMEIIEDRHNTKATIIASQIPIANWYDIIGENTIADAIMDRLIHTSHQLELKGESLRKIKL